MLTVGDTLGRFQLMRELGQGSFGVVFEAEDVLVGERVAIKALHPWYTQEPTLRERFRRELLFTRKITHPGVCRVHELHEHDDVLFISMQLVRGRTLSAVTKQDRPGARRAVHLLRQIAQALHAAHAEGVVHRDLKPANILVTDDDRAVILDFGIASGDGARGLTRPGEALGSMPYIPMEVWQGLPATALGDQYALGVTAYVLLTASLPYSGKTPVEFRDALRLQRPNIAAKSPGIDPELEWVILKAMAVDADARFPAVADFDAALARIEARLVATPDVDHSTDKFPRGKEFTAPAPVTMGPTPPSTTTSALVTFDPPTPPTASAPRSCAVRPKPKPKPRPTTTSPPRLCWARRRRTTATANPCPSPCPTPRAWGTTPPSSARTSFANAFPPGPPPRQAPWRRGQRWGSSRSSPPSSSSSSCAGPATAPTPPSWWATRPSPTSPTSLTSWMETSWMETSSMPPSAMMSSPAATALKTTSATATRRLPRGRPGASRRRRWRG